MRKTIAFGLCLIMALAVARVPLDSGLMGDANGDRQVDVLDLQTVITQVLEGDVNNPRADVNADGRVDICDYQCILEQAKGKRPEGPDSGDKGSQQAIAAERLGLPLLRGDLLSEPAPSGDECTPCAPITSDAGPLGVSVPDTWRYTFTLLPHAPPAIM